MAPIRPGSRRTKATPIASRTPKTNYPSTPSSSSSAFTVTKKDKRLVKHSLLLSKIRKSAPGNASKKRRRPSKKLVTTLESLVDALPSHANDGVDGNGSSKREKNAAEEALGRSRGSDAAGGLKSKPGVRRRRERMEKLERERFGKNLAVLSMARGADEQAGKEIKGAAPGTDRWSVLRRHIEMGMEKQGG